MMLRFRFIPMRPHTSHTVSSFSFGLPRRSLWIGVYLHRYGWAMGISLSLAMSLFAVLMQMQQTPIETFSDPPDGWMPGAGYPADLHCTPLHDGNETVDCEGELPNSDWTVWVSYIGTSGQIQMTIEYTPRLVLGSVLLRWGPPNGFRAQTGRILLYWNMQHAMVMLPSCSLHTTTPVDFILYRDESSGGQARFTPWSGFVGEIPGC